MKRIMISLFVLLLLCGCTATTQLKDRTVVTALTFDERGGEFHVSALCLRSSENGAEKLIASGSGLSPFSALSSLCLAQKNILNRQMLDPFIGSNDVVVMGQQAVMKAFYDNHG